MGEVTNSMILAKMPNSNHTTKKVQWTGDRPGMPGKLSRLNAVWIQQKNQTQEPLVSSCFTEERWVWNRPACLHYQVKLSSGSSSSSSNLQAPLWALPSSKTCPKSIPAWCGTAITQQADCERELGAELQNTRMKCNCWVGLEDMLLYLTTFYRKALWYGLLL